MGTSSFFEYPTGDETPPTEEGFLTDLTAEDLAILLDHVEVRRVRADEVVMRLGERDPCLYIVTTGMLEARAPRRRGHRRIATFPAGSVVGELTFLDGQRRSADVVALTDGEVLRLSRMAFDSLSATHPSLGRTILLDLARVLAGRLRDASATVSRLSR